MSIKCPETVATYKAESPVCADAAGFGLFGNLPWPLDMTITYQRNFTPCVTALYRNTAISCPSLFFR